MARAKLERTRPDLEGEVFSGRYRVIACIGEGALGSVHVVEHIQVGRRFALKVLRQEHCHSATILERFRQEAKLGGRLQSPHTVQVLDYDTWRGTPYLVMEYLEGENLHALLMREGPLPVFRAASLLVGACRGTSAAHALGVLHRDLKPSNLFVCRDGEREQCKVLDFGVAKVCEASIATSVAPSTSTGAIVGTLAYMAPEQIRGEADVDERADVYALGAILYECLAGAKVFDALTPPTLMYKILEEDPRPLGELRPDLPPAIVHCVHRALERDPAARFQSARELELTLERFTGSAIEASNRLSGDDTGAGSERAFSSTAARAVERERPKGPTWALTLACALGAGAIGATLALVLTQKLPVVDPATSAVASEEPQGLAASIGSAAAMETLVVEERVALQPMSAQPMSAQPMSTQPLANPPSHEQAVPVAASNRAVGAHDSEAQRIRLATARTPKPSVPRGFAAASPLAAPQAVPKPEAQRKDADFERDNPYRKAE